MKTQKPFACLTLAMSLSLSLSISNPAFASADDHTPRYGGIVVPQKIYDYELVAKPGVIQLYLRDHGKPADMAKASAKLTLLSGTDKQEVELKPVGGKLEATGIFKVGPGTKAVAVVTIAGKPVGSVRFVLN
jgi:hypothetical protein